MRVHMLSGQHRYLYDVGNQLRDHVHRRSREAFAQGNRDRDDVTDKASLSARQAFIRSTTLALLGGVPSMETPLQPRVTGVVKGNDFMIEKVVFESRPSHYVTANLYKPDSLQNEAPSPAILFLCGHFDDGKQASEYQAVCQILTRAGFIVLAVDPIGQGERHGYDDGKAGFSLMAGPTMEHDYIGAQCLLAGMPLARFFLHDAMRSIDYLSSLPEVDSARIGVTGNSGGGMQTALLMLADSRVAAAAPATFIMNRETYMPSGGAQDAEQIWPGFTAAGLDHEDILIAMSPKPVLILACASDFFTIEGTESTFERVGRFWEMYDRSDDLRMYVEQTYHQYTQAMAKQAASFFAEHLRQETVELSDVAMELFDPQLLWCTDKGSVLSEYAQAQTVHDHVVERTQQLEQQALTGALESESGLAWLRRQVFASRQSGPFKLRSVPLGGATGRIYDLEGESILWWSQSDIFNHALVLRSVDHYDPEQQPTIALWEGGTTRAHEHFTWIRNTCLHGGAVVVLDLTGMGSLTPHPVNEHPMHDHYGTIHQLANDLIWIGDSLSAIRVYDLLRFLDLLPELGLRSGTAAIYANGRQDLYARLAGMLDERIVSIEAVEGMGKLTELVRSRFYNDYDIHSYLIPQLLEHVTV